MTRARTPGLLLLPLVLALTACGDDTDPKAEFVAKAEAICERAKAVRDTTPQPTSIAALETYVATLVDAAVSAQTDLRALELPAADAAELRSKLLDPLAADVEAGKAYQAKVEAAGGDPTRLLGLISSRPKPSVDTAYARAYGLTTCAEAIG